LERLTEEPLRSLPVPSSCSLNDLYPSLSVREETADKCSGVVSFITILGDFILFYFVFSFVVLLRLLEKKEELMMAQSMRSIDSNKGGGANKRI
jgi:hypothetical protein